jgi:hypothetical protein
MRGGGFLAIAVLLLTVAGCQTDDLPPQPGYVSYAENGPAHVAPSVTSAQTTGRGLGDKSYFVEFRSRYALSYGHTYVVFGRMNDSGAVVEREVAGLHPASTSEVPYVVGHFVPVPAETGESDGDLEEQYRSASWRVMMDQARYGEVVAYIRKLQASSPVWQASVYNCNAFTGRVASFMGYKAPSPYLRPQQFITTLRERNT